MKIIITFILTLLITSLMAQSPNKFSYQAVVRDANNHLIINKPIGIKYTILRGSNQVAMTYPKAEIKSTDSNGVVSIEISSDYLGNFNWDEVSFFIKIEIDPLGGNNYTISSISELLSVPYSFFSNHSKWSNYSWHPFIWDTYNGNWMSGSSEAGRIGILEGSTTNKSGEKEYILPVDCTGDNTFILSLEINTGNAWYGGTSIKAGTGSVSYSINDNKIRIYHEENAYYRNRKFKIVFLVFSRQFRN